MKAHLVHSLLDAGPGAAKPGANDAGEIIALNIRCPGCNVIDSLPLKPFGSRAFWEIAAGDARQPETLTLSPSVHHDVPECGWHGYLRNGEWVSC